MNFSLRNKRLRPLFDKDIRLALEADIPSGSEDERFGLIDDSDLDKDYWTPNDEQSEAEQQIYQLVLIWLTSTFKQSHMRLLFEFATKCERSFPDLYLSWS